jgi:hypothetical protein
MKTLSCLALALLLGAQENKPQDNRKKAFVDAESAGADFKVQGEYEAEGAKFAAQVVALGDGKFDVYLLGGGLPGKGWDQKTRIKVPAATADGKTAIAGKDWSGEIRDGALAAKGPDGEVSLKRVLRKSPTEGEKPPAGAIVLFDGSSADEWQGGKLIEGSLLNMGVNSKRKFGNVKLHIEFRLSFMPWGRGQGRSNSGVYLAGRHEVQVLDSFGLTGENNECGGIYSIAKPAVNMCFPPLSWQTYDVEYRLATAEKGATMTVWHNGFKIHENLEIKKKTTASVDANPDTTPGPIHLQNHGDPLAYRNIWVVELKEEKP